jgi:hypothetical protein
VDSNRVTPHWDQEDTKSNTNNQQQVQHDEGSYLEERERKERERKEKERKEKERKEKEGKRRLETILVIPKKKPDDSIRVRRRKLTGLISKGGYLFVKRASEK